VSVSELHDLSAHAAPRTLDTALFDLDGTLIDSIELIRQSYAHTLRVHRNFEPPLEFWLDGLGRPLRWQFAHFSADAAEIEAMVATYRAYNLARHDEMICAFDGAVDAVAQLKSRGLKLGVVTSKMHAGALRGLKHCGFDGLFDVVIGADNVEEHKPHPAPVHAALAHLGASAESAVMVGDSPHDLASGRGARAFTAAVAWGPFPREQLLATAPDYWLETPREIAVQFLAARG